MKRVLIVSALAIAFTGTAYAQAVLVPQTSTINPFAATQSSPSTVDTTTAPSLTSGRSTPVDPVVPVVPGTPSVPIYKVPASGYGNVPSVYQPYINSAQKQAQITSKIDQAAIQGSAAAANNPSLGRSQAAYREFQQSQQQNLKLQAGQVGAVPSVYQAYIANGLKQVSNSAQQDSVNMQDAAAIANDPKLANDPTVIQKYMNNIMNQQ